jgi:hypothetical protein
MMHPVAGKTRQTRRRDECDCPPKIRGSRGRVNGRPNSGNYRSMSMKRYSSRS